MSSVVDLKFAPLFVAGAEANFKSENHTRVIRFLVSLSNPKFVRSPTHHQANFGFGTLATPGFPLFCGGRRLEVAKDFRLFHVMPAAMTDRAQQFLDLGRIFRNHVGVLFAPRALQIGMDHVSLDR